MLTIDGSSGEGGGQIVRSSLALSMITGTPVRIERIRAGRKRPGLMRQHLTAVRAAVEVSGGRAEGAAIGSTGVTFAPGDVRGGTYAYSIGTAGSTTLVLQTILPALIVADEPSSLTFEGGTHNPFAPPFPFLERAFVPLVRRMGADVTLTLERPGFYPAGGGRFTVEVRPTSRLSAIELMERGRIRRRRATAIVAGLPRHIAERELARIGRKANWRDDELVVEEIRDPPGPGNVVLLEVESEHVTEVFTGFGERGVPAETVADRVVDAYRRYLKADVPVGANLADQIMLPMAIAGAGAFRTLPLSRHSTTHIDLIRQLLDVPIDVEEVGETRIVRFG